jgi:hypothetical protein
VSRSEAVTGSSSDLTWPRLHDRALSEAYASVLCGQSWCLFSYARDEMSFDEMAEQHAHIIDGLDRRDGACDPIRLQTMMAHYRTNGASTRLEPWMFATGSVRRDLVAWFCFRFRRPIAFWGDGNSIYALTPDEDQTRAPWGASARSLGPFRPAAIAHAIHESAPAAAAFLGFDLPVPTFCEALLWATLIR